jgi:flagellar protein FlbD
MIEVTRINGEAIIVNALMIEFVEATPDTVISLMTGRKLMVKESLQTVRQSAEKYHRLIGPFPRPQEGEEVMGEIPARSGAKAG